MGVTGGDIGLPERNGGKCIATLAPLIGEFRCRLTQE
jgi:hypothetical protein